MWWPAYAGVVRSSRIWGSRIFRERFDLESQNFTRAFIPAGPTYHHTGYDVANYFRPNIILRKSSKMPPPTASGGISRERFKRGSRNFTAFSGTIGPTSIPDMTSLALSGRLQNVFKYCTKSRIIPPLFNQESPNSARTSTPIQSKVSEPFVFKTKSKPLRFRHALTFRCCQGNHRWFSWSFKIGLATCK